ncbi:MAG: HaeIII family restriction endonuclease [Kiritimatiellia bacterium]
MKGLSANDFGRAFEYACLAALDEAISPVRACQIARNKSYQIVATAWGKADESLRGTLASGARSMVGTLCGLEPRIMEPSEDTLVLASQADARGIVGDVRDIVIRRKEVRWEVGLSVKHNHFAVKHSRLGARLDFCRKWFAFRRRWCT